MTRSLVLLALALALAACSDKQEPRIAVAQTKEAPPTERVDSAPRVVDLSRFFDSLEGTFVLLDDESGSTRVYNPERAAQRFIPASTFKIPNSLIALETGVAPDAELVIEWDSVRNPPKNYWPPAWRGRQTLRTAFQRSVVWYYQEIARRIGEERMRDYLKRFGYGNQDMRPALDKFWLQGELRISPNEQVAFLRRLYHGQLGLSDRTTSTMKEIMLLGDTLGYKLYGKTGTADLTPTRELGWLVGFVEQGEKRYFYALNMEGEAVWEKWPPQRRAELVRRLLKELGVGGSS